MTLRVSQIAPGVHRLASRYENWYVLEAGGRLTVLDAGLPRQWPDFVTALARLGHTPADVDAVLITLPYLRRRWYRVYMLHLLRNRVTRVPSIARLDELADGDVLDVPGSPRVVHAPGHTAGSCALFVEDRSLLFSGDALVTLDMTRGRTGPQIIRGPQTDDAERALESLDVLASTKAQTVLPGHGEPWLDGVASAVKIARGT